ncbi:MAG: hypothetical protein Q8906_13495 [Bacillota bacterium]|nr:hypothetical protein [Bacillota bacterium]
MLILLELIENVRIFFTKVNNKKRIQSTICFIAVIVLSACSHSPKESANSKTTVVNMQRDEAKAKIIKKTPLVPATPVKLQDAVFTGLNLTHDQGKQRFSQFTIDQTKNAVIKYKIYQDLNPSLTVFRSKQDIANVLWGIKKANLNVNQVDVIVTNSITEQSGTTTEKQILNVVFTKDSIQKTDFESYNTDNILYIANKILFKDPSYVW